MILDCKALCSFDNIINVNVVCPFMAYVTTLAGITGVHPILRLHFYEIMHKILDKQNYCVPIHVPIHYMCMYMIYGNKVIKLHDNANTMQPSCYSPFITSL